MACLTIRSVSSPQNVMNSADPWSSTTTNKPRKRYGSRRQNSGGTTGPAQGHRRQGAAAGSRASRATADHAPMGAFEIIVGFKGWVRIDRLRRFRCTLPMLRTIVLPVRYEAGGPG